MKPKERFEKLLEKYENDPEYIAEGLLIDITEQIVDLVERAQLNRTQLAQKLNCSNAYVTKLLNGSENLTVKKLVQIAQALDCSIDLAFIPSRYELRRYFTYAPKRLVVEAFQEEVKLPDTYETPVPLAA
jgi:transcriptional regulator with XRE-family HTH domain